MRTLVIASVMLALLASSSAWAVSLNGPPVDSDSWRADFYTDDFSQYGPAGEPVNYINLRTRPNVGSTSLGFESVQFVPTEYTVSISVPDAQLAVIAPVITTYDGPEIYTFRINWPGGPTQSVALDWAECYRTAAGDIKAYSCGTIWGTTPGDWCGDRTYYDSAPQDNSPEPATWALLLATVAFGGLAKRRKRT